MNVVIKGEIECHCGDTASRIIRHVDLDPSTETVELVIHAGLTIGDSTFRCGTCRCELFIGDLADITEDEDECEDEAE